MTREAGASRLGSQAGAWEPADGWFFTVINKNDEENERKLGATPVFIDFQSG
jgi:hypothetical protein